jgi:Rrf2 family transcriptional regulator, nitric oxide-sensitive transcriptional repressor
VFSQTAEYALRAAVYLASHPDELASSETLALHTKVPQGYLSKVMNDLVAAGIAISRRGPRGGFVLARPSIQITVLEVVNAVDPLKRITTCPLGIPSHGTKLCKLHRRLDDAIATVEKALGDATLADMVERSTRTDCSFPLQPVQPTVKRGKPE